MGNNHLLGADVCLFLEVSRHVQMCMSAQFGLKKAIYKFTIWFWGEGGSKGKGWLYLLFIAIQKVCESLAKHSQQSYFCINKDFVQEAFRLNSALLL